MKQAATFAVRTAGEPGAFAPGARDIVRQVDPCPRGARRAWTPSSRSGRNDLHQDAVGRVGLLEAAHLVVGQ